MEAKRGRPPVEKVPRACTVRARVTADMYASLQAIAREDGASESEVVRRLIADEIRRRQGRKGKR